MEFSGTIEEFGDGDRQGFEVGEEVFGLAYGGAYAEFIVVSTRMLMRKPQELSWEEAAGVPEVGNFSLSLSSFLLEPSIRFTLTIDGTMRWKPLYGY